jgi:hypothetical protein
MVSPFITCVTVGVRRKTISGRITKLIKVSHNKFCIRVGSFLPRFV